MSRRASVWVCSMASDSLASSGRASKLSCAYHASAAARNCTVPGGQLQAGQTQPPCLSSQSLHGFYTRSGNTHTVSLSQHAVQQPAQHSAVRASAAQAHTRPGRWGDVQSSFSLAVCAVCVVRLDDSPANLLRSQQQQLQHLSDAGLSIAGVSLSQPASLAHISKPLTPLLSPHHHPPPLHPA